MNNELNDNIEELDSTWLQEFQNLDDEYKNYYTEELSFIRINSVYVNTNNEIEKINEEKVLLKNAGILQKEELLSIIKHNILSNNNKYSLLSILKFNINIEPIHLNNFLKNKDINVGSSFLQSIKNIDSIKFDKSISMFHDINSILIIFHQKKISKDKNHLLNCTKKMWTCSNTKKKTRRKEFKEMNA